MISDFPIIYQMPELPTGCEITAMTMVLDYYGMDVDKVTMATEYLPALSSFDQYYEEDGNLYGNDLYDFFIGDPTSVWGYVCGPGAIETAANGFLEDAKSAWRAYDITGTDAEALYEYVSQDRPIVVWGTIDMTDRGTVEGWYTSEGKYVDWSTRDHCAVLIGYSIDTITLADPLAGEVVYDRDQFERVFEARSNQCVLLAEHGSEANERAGR